MSLKREKNMPKNVWRTLKRKWNKTLVVRREGIAKRQFTGLRDTNGREIYEGDVLIVPDLYDLPENTSMTYNNQAVTFENHSFCVGGQPMHEDDDYISDECEVIGNIYENPELLPA